MEEVRTESVDYVLCTLHTAAVQSAAPEGYSILTRSSWY